MSYFPEKNEAEEDLYKSLLPHLPTYLHLCLYILPLLQLEYMSDQYINLRLTPVLVTRPHLLLPTQEHCCSVTQLCSTLCDPMDCSMPGFPVLHHLLELAQTHVH